MLIFSSSLILKATTINGVFSLKKITSEEMQLVYTLGQVLTRTFEE